MIRVRRKSDTAEQALEQLHEILRGYPGNCELQLVLAFSDGAG